MAHLTLVSRSDDTADHDTANRDMQAQPEEILVVEDSASQRAALSRLLHNWGFQVVTAADGAEALDYCRRRKPALVISDWMMPEMDGPTLCQRIRALEGRGYTYFILLTARNLKQDVANGLNAGADDYLSKPIDNTELRARVTAGLRIVRLHQEVDHAATHDSLTGLPNRHDFQTRLKIALHEADTAGQKLGIMLFDVDHFKTINDSCGHDCGDAVLLEFGRRLSASVRHSDFVARLGGDEFAALIRGDLTPEILGRIAERVQDNLRREIIVPTGRQMVSASIGIATFPDDATTPAGLIKSADIALYEAKSSGRARHCFFNPTLASQISARYQTLRAIEQALEAGEIVPFYQPIVHAQDGQIAGFEALVRWVRPDLPPSLPQAFFAALEDPVLSVAVGQAVSEHVLDTLESWNARGFDVGRISINVSTEQLVRGEFCRGLIDEIRHRSLQARQVAIEVTERVMLSEDKNARIEASLQCLQEAGVEIDLDDFGTGYASLTHLSRLDVARIKIDRSFIAAAPQDAHAMAIVQALITLAHQLDKTIVAEGVETRDQADFLRTLGCDYLQGFLFSPAVPADDAAKFLIHTPPWQRQHAVSNSDEV